MTNPKITRFPEAEYKKTGLPEYDENPLIAALPVIMSPIEVAKSLRKRPHFQPEEINLPCHIRTHAIRKYIGYSRGHGLEQHLKINLTIQKTTTG
ncbi:hypothetical protein [Alteromonas alba]|uniref:hypothetical protein n=1 Tax=Alteromonas alba TaxID=2079529 RepID=UPI00196A8BC1|nr:hypothetical protein [Alteromonas alba]